MVLRDLGDDKRSGDRSPATPFTRWSGDGRALPSNPRPTPLRDPPHPGPPDAQDPTSHGCGVGVEGKRPQSRGPPAEALEEGPDPTHGSAETVRVAPRDRSTRGVGGRPGPPGGGGRKACVNPGSTRDLPKPDPKGPEPCGLGRVSTVRTSTVRKSSLLRSVTVAFTVAPTRGSRVFPTPRVYGNLR